MKALTNDQAIGFIHGGNATFTFKSVRTGTHFTYKTKEIENSPGKFFVMWLCGSDNESDYAYLGMINANNFFLTKGSKAGKDSKVFQAFDWTYKALNQGVLNGQVEIFHEGRCCRCNRKLTTPDSIESGIGPECAKKSR